MNDMLLLKEATQDDIPDFAAKSRMYPLFFPNNRIVRQRNTYHVPAGFKIDFIPESWQLSLDIMDIRKQYTKKDDQIIVLSQTHTKRTQMPANRWEDVKNFRNELYKRDDQYIVLKKTNVSPEAKDWIKKQ